MAEGQEPRLRRNMRHLIEIFEARNNITGEEDVADTVNTILDDMIGGETEATAAFHSPAADLEALIERLERVTSRLERLPQLLPPSPPATPATPASPAPSVTQQDELQLVISDNMSISGFQDIIQGPLRTYLELSKQIGGDVATHANLVGNAFQAQMRYIQLAGSRSKPSQSEEMQLLAPTSEQISAIQGFREKNRASKLFNHLSAISESIPALGWVAIAPTPAPYVKEMNDAGQFYTNRVLKEWKDKNVKHVEWCRAWVQLLTELQAYVKQYHTTGLVWSGKGAGAPPPPPGGMPPPPPVLPAADFSNLSVDDRSALFAEINQGENITSSLRKVTSDMQTHKNPSLRQGPAPFKAASHTPSKALPQPGAGAVDKPPVFARDGKKWLIVSIILPARVAPFKAASHTPSKALPQPGAGAVDKPPVFARDGKKWLIVSIILPARVAPFKAASHTPSKALPQPGAGAVDKPPVFARDGKKWLIVSIILPARVAPFKAASHTPSKALPQPGAGAVDKPPVFARDGKKWLIEYQKGNANLVVENAEMNNVVYMFRCRDSALTVRGKVNGVVLDSCTKCAVVFDNLVSSVEFVNCQSVQMQVLGKVPTISVDKTDGCQIYLSKDALDVEIVSSKSSEMNVLVPKGNGDYTEWPVPEQFKTVVNKSGGLSTTPVESKG
ncbi:adenylyl cyclase-associated protein 1 isoform X3 [Leguminivora glycinivorella]|uniref:adenylyl cyclase-associated protein 1 isoform X3 n=1 Tax=Leguminivora glycinivorella TaxID=1035111 RepID=UPI00200F7EAA|nr:adenylyl cyclase-associated protein 1 isoform X3 [Leguminivora glycinivorella]